MIAACGEKEAAEPAAPPPPKLTAEQSMLKVLLDDKASAAVFAIEPVNRFACKSISATLLQKDKSDGFWFPVETITALFDVNNPARRTPIKDQILYATLEKPGTYAISNITCEPFVEDDQNQTISWKPKVGTFDAEYGKLNYIGTLKQHKLSDAVFIYDIEDQNEAVGAKITAKNAELAAYLQPNLMAAQKVSNFDGRKLTIAQVMDNKHRSADYYKLFGMLERKRDFVARKSDEIIENYTRIRWKSVGDAMQQTAYYANLADRYQESIYKFEDVVSRSGNFDQVEAYFLMRITLDRTHAFRDSCTFKDSLESLNDPCAAAESSYAIASRDIADYVSRTGLDIRDTKIEAAIKQKRAELINNLNLANTEFLSLALQLEGEVSDDRRARVVALNTALYKALGDLSEFDAKRAFDRYNLSDSDREYYLSIVNSITDHERDVSELNIQKFNNKDFDQLDELREKRAELVRLKEVKKAIDAQLF